MRWKSCGVILCCGGTIPNWRTSEHNACSVPTRWSTRYSHGVSLAGAGEEDGGMNERLRFRYFAHSWISDWNHGNAQACAAWLED